RRKRQKKEEFTKQEELRSCACVGFGRGMALIIANVDSRDFPYSRGDKIGDGGFGIVYLCYSKEKRAGSRKKYALKVVEKVRGPDGQRLQDLIMREAEILSKLDHPRIVALEAFFDLQRSYALVMEYVGGGELFYRFHAKKKYSEEDARVLVRNLLTAVAYLHKTGICHRDLKPENIVLADERNDTNIKLIDFGLAAHLPSKGAGNPYMVDFCGTPEYQAPEQLMRKPYTTKADNFAVGIIAYLLVSGYHPWKFFRLKATGKLVADGEFTKRMCYRNAEFHEEKWFGVTEECKVRGVSLTLAFLRVFCLRRKWQRGKCHPHVPALHPWLSASPRVKLPPLLWSSLLPRTAAADASSQIARNLVFCPLFV
ncbi:unnamed protein product, partial [Phaeothamnion confervicola]